VRIANNNKPEKIPITRNNLCINFAYPLTKLISPLPMVCPITIDAAEDAPIAVDFTIIKIVDATLFAAIAAVAICPKMTVCKAVFSPHNPCTTSMGAVNLR